MKKLFFISILLGTLFFLNACSPGYINAEPTAIITTRPNRPSTNHVWINDSWVWRQRNHNYTPRSGYWARPHRGRSYNQGSWNKNPKGYRWKSGTWR
jgi:hypothetical protein